MAKETSQRPKPIATIIAFLLVLLVAVFVIYTFVLNRGGTDTGQAAYKLAVNMPLTGPLSIFGEPVRKGLVMAEDELVGKGTIKKEQYDINFEDNQGKEDWGLTIWNKQKALKPDIYISGVGINTFVFNKRVEEAGIPHVIFGWKIDLTLTTNANYIRQMC